MLIIVTNPEIILLTETEVEQLAPLDELMPHPLTEAMPVSVDAEQDALNASVRAHPDGAQMILCEGQILDGRRLVKSCVDAGVRPTIFRYAGDDPAGFLIRRNLVRAHFTPSRLAMSEILCRNWTGPGRPRNDAGNARFSDGREPPFTNGQMAEEVGESVRLIRGAKAAFKAVLHLRVLSGELSISGALSVICATRLRGSRVR